MRSAALVIAVAVFGCAYRAPTRAPAMIDWSPPENGHEVHCGPGEPDAIVGTLRDQDGTPMVGATIVVSDSIQRSAVADDTGDFAIRDLSKGAHQVVLYFKDVTFSFGEVATGTRIDATVSASHARPNEMVRAGAPVIHVAHLAQGTTIESSWLHNVPFGR